MDEATSLQVAETGGLVTEPDARWRRHLTLCVVYESPQGIHIVAGGSAPGKQASR